jgi:hypothetical protein
MAQKPPRRSSLLTVSATSYKAGLATYATPGLCGHIGASFPKPVGGLFSEK